MSTCSWTLKKSCNHGQRGGAVSLGRQCARVLLSLHCITRLECVVVPEYSVVTESTDRPVSSWYMNVAEVM